MKKFLPIGIIGLSLVLLVLVYRTPPLVLSATNHVVISEIQVRGISDADDEFVELYNPTGSSIDLAGWKLTKRTETATSDANLVASISGTIPAHGFFLITSQDSLASGSADKIYSTSGRIAADNSVLLYEKGNAVPVDLVGMGAANTNESSAAAAIPPNGGSIERKALSSSTADSMGIGGADEFAGNGEDTDHNFNDFVTRTASQPQNSQSSIEPPLVSPSPSVSPEPTIEPTPTPLTSATPEPTATASPTLEPSSTPSVSPSPTIVPSPTPSPTLEPTPTPTIEPSITPTPTPTIIPTPTSSPVPTVTPSVNPSPSATPRPTSTPSTTPTVTPSVSPQPSPLENTIFNGLLFTCTLQRRIIHTRWFTFYLPQVNCRRK